MTNASRKARGAQTQRLAAEYAQTHGFPFATDAGAGRSGRDILNMLGLAVEVKGRRSLELGSWLRQAVSNAGDDLPLVIARLDGQGEAALDDWPMIFRQADGYRILRAAGYGDPVDVPIVGHTS